MTLGADGLAQSKYYILLVGMVLSPRSALRAYPEPFCSPVTAENPCHRATHYSFQRSSKHSATLQPPAQLFTVPPNISAFFLALVSAGLSDRLSPRSIHAGWMPVGNHWVRYAHSCKTPYGHLWRQFFRGCRRIPR
jgi:hypothetical protein